MAPSQQLTFTVKSEYGSDVRRFSEPTNVTLQQLGATIAQLYRLTSSVALKYADDEGDLITLASDSDLRDAIEGFQRAGASALKVCVLDASTSVNTATGIVANVPVSANVATNAPETIVPVVASPITTTPISDISTTAESPLSSNVVTAVPVTDNVTNVVTLDGSPITTNVVNMSDIGINVGNGNVSAQAQVFPFVNVANLNTFIPFLYQLQHMGFGDAKRNIDLLNHYKGHYLKVLTHLSQERQTAAAQSQRTRPSSRS